MRLLCVLILSVVYMQAFGQSLKGKVVDEKSEALAGASCVIYSLPDSAYVSGIVTDHDGAFSVPSVQADDWFLKVSYLGYRPFSVTKSSCIETVMSCSPLNIVLYPENSELNEVTVTAERPQLTMNGEVLSYNVKDILRTHVVSSAHDLLTKLPLVNSMDGTSLTLSGAPLGSVVYINGKRSQMSDSQLMEYLKTLPAEQVKDVQIVYSPSPKWKTNASVINVVIKKQDAYTFNGQLNLSGVNKHANSLYTGASVFAGLPKWNFNAMYNYGNSRSREKEVQTIRHTVSDETRIINDTCLEKSFSLSHNVYASASYDIGKKSNVELTYNGSFAPKVSDRRLSNNTYVGASDSYSDGDSRINSVALTYQSPIGISGGVEYLNFHLSSGQDLNGLKNGGTGDLLLKSTSRQNINKARLYADGYHSLGNNWTVTYGTSYEMSRNHNRQENLPSGMAPSSDSNTDEYVARIYAGFSKWIFNNKLGISATATGEYYKINDYSKNALFPNVSLTFVPSSKHIMQASFNSFKRYPSFWQRQDFVSYTNLYKMKVGNPDLRPAVYSSMQLIYVFHNKYVLTSSYTNVKDFFFSQPYLSPTGFVQIDKTFNLEDYDSFDVSLSIPVSAGNVWHSNINASVTYDRFKMNDWHRLGFDRSKWVGRIFMQNSFTVCTKPRIELELSGLYRTANILGLWERPSLWTINSGASMELLDGKLSVKLQANDIFQSYIPLQTMDYSNQRLVVDSNYYGRSFRLTVAYKFRGYKEKRIKDIDTSRYGID